MSEDLSKEFGEGSVVATETRVRPMQREFFPKAILPAELKLPDLKHEGLTLVTEQARWLGLPGDEERLRQRYGDRRSEFGELAWRELGERIASVYGSRSRREVAKLLKEVRGVHDRFYEKASALPVERQTYYHNVSRWEEGTGHADQVTIQAARELVGALESGELDEDRFSLDRFGLILQAMMVHDADWSLVDKKQEIQVSGTELFGIKPEDLAEVLAVVTMVDYDQDSASKTMRKMARALLIEEKGWGEDVTSLIHAVVRRSDLLQVADRNYGGNLHSLVTDFYLRRPDYANHWNVDDPMKAVEASVPFYLFAEKKVLSDGPRSFRFSDTYYGRRQRNLVRDGWRGFEEQVRRTDPVGWEDYQEGKRVLAFPFE
ncbi:MAG: hypothetical protein A3A65_03545 [Candidatus Chisholmbacteria bacterium RIFCSPLOWO2_01_FULL_49_14]|uniref:Uncharacterized protein n=1 Tax=Candidatus Chisholmbacteria bacterium RIFCSPLOWO2_01_FULL_49_14 TaxID=1797593 RepID=A0A1G1W0D8_9BACT|nr:MAG: hypothetical protein A3A65_03545 [Candidatus Chisholmbacteria bacterium RIFCSPLOWO2_01_FULL_49_14]